MDAKEKTVGNRKCVICVVQSSSTGLVQNAGKLLIHVSFGFTSSSATANDVAIKVLG